VADEDGRVEVVDEASEAGADAVEARVVRVELFEDRAAVTRELTLPSPGRHRLRIGPVSPVVSERGITFPGISSGEEASGVRATLEEVRVERVRTTRVDADPAEIARLQAAWREAQDEATALADAHRRATERVGRAVAAVEAAREATPRALLELEAPVAWVEAVTELAEAVAEARQDELARRSALARHQEEVSRLHSQLEAARRGRPVVRAFVVLSLLAEEAGPLQLRYVVPCAVWRPSHRASLVTDLASPRIAWELTAVCWNATGEDWTGVALECSTARPGDLAEPPELEDDPIDVQRRDREVVVEARDEQIQVARERGARAHPGSSHPGGPHPGVFVGGPHPGVDDGGEPRTFRAEAPVTLPSDGRPVTVRLDRWEAEATARWLALPEQAGAAVMRTVQRNGGTRPILAGPIELVRDGMALGRGRVPLVAPGEPFPLGFGTHDGLRIRRKREQRSDRTAITGRQWRTIEVEVQVSHLGAEPCRLEVRERVPTSELKEVRVSAPTAEPALDAPMDDDGFVRWTLELAPGEQRTLKLSYTVDAAPNVQLPF
jgi:uncharacterized protein (TIGR02231 family)